MFNKKQLDRIEKEIFKLNQRENMNNVYQVHMKEKIEELETIIVYIKNFIDDGNTFKLLVKQAIEQSKEQKFKVFEDKISRLITTVDEMKECRISKQDLKSVVKQSIEEFREKMIEDKKKEVKPIKKVK